MCEGARLQSCHKLFKMREWGFSPCTPEAEFKPAISLFSAACLAPEGSPPLPKAYFPTQVKLAASFVSPVPLYCATLGYAHSGRVINN